MGRTSETETPETVDPPTVPQAEKSPSPATPPTNAPASAIDVDPGSGRDVSLVDGFRITPPETFNVIQEEEGSDFQSSYTHVRWERSSGGAWFIVSFLSGIEFEGARKPNIHDPQVVRQRIQAAFARIDEGHALRSNGSQKEKLAGLDAVRTNVIGTTNGQTAVGHLYLLTHGKYLIEIAALATEPQRDALKYGRESANSLTLVTLP